MSIKSLVEQWEKNAQGSLTNEQYQVRLTHEDAAKLSALSEIYSRRTKEQIISELVAAALAEIESSFPYIASSQVATIDEFGDPVYEDAGRTPTFQDLTRKHFARHKAANA